jgi:hypothetical protein
MRPGMDLALCRFCGDETVVPVRWEQDGPGRWWIRLRCGDCGSFRETIATDEQLLAFDTLIHRRAQPIADAIAQLDANAWHDRRTTSPPLWSMTSSTHMTSPALDEGHPRAVV